MKKAKMPILNNRLVMIRIMDILRKSNAPEMDDLFKQVKGFYDDLGRASFERNLMILELRGLIRVSDTTRNQRRVELVVG